MTMHVTCNAVSLDQLEPKKAHEELLKDWQLFLFEYKNSLRPQANNSLSCSWNNSYCALGPTLAASTKLMCIFQLDNKKHAERRTLFEKWAQPRFLPRLRLWECPCYAGLLSHQTPHFPRVHFCFLSSSKLNDKMSEGLLWLGTLSIQTGTSKSLSTWKMTPIILSLSSFADQLLRNAPRTASLSVNSTTRQVLISSFQTFMAASTAIISSPWMTVFWPLAIISSNVPVSTSTLKNDMTFSDMLTIMLKTTVARVVGRGIYIYMKDLCLWRLDLSGSVPNQQFTNVTKTSLSMLR